MKSINFRRDVKFQRSLLVFLEIKKKKIVLAPNSRYEHFKILLHEEHNNFRCTIRNDILYYTRHKNCSFLDDFTLKKKNNNKMIFFIRIDNYSLIVPTRHLPSETLYYFT